MDLKIPGPRNQIQFLNWIPIANPLGSPMKRKREMCLQFENFDLVKEQYFKSTFGNIVDIFLLLCV